MSKVQPKEVQMSPAMAAYILKNNTKNRPISRVVVKRYADVMKAGRWFLNGEAIIIADDGTLMDGQHRLQAVVVSQKTVPMIVVKGVSKKSFRTIDVGKKRSGADALATFSESYEKNRGLIAAAAKIVHAFDGPQFRLNFDREKLDNDLMIDFVERNKGIVRSVEYTLTLTTARKVAPVSVLAALHYLFTKKDIDKAEKFFNRLNSGENLNAGDPTGVLRTKLFLLSQETGIIRARECIPYFTKAWEALRAGRKIEKIRIDTDYIPTIV